MKRPDRYALLLAASLLSAIVADVSAQTELQDYTSQLIKLTVLTDDRQYREAIDGYRTLEAQAGTPGWLKAACEYETAELYALLDETAKAVAALGRSAQLGFDDCNTSRTSETLRPILVDPKAAQILAGMQIAEGDFRELLWLQAEVLHARHDGRMMVIENTNRLDHEATAIPQAQLPARPTTSAGVFYRRLQLLVRQRMPGICDEG